MSGLRSDSLKPPGMRGSAPDRIDQPRFQRHRSKPQNAGSVGSIAIQRRHGLCPKAGGVKNDLARLGIRRNGNTPCKAIRADPTRQAQPLKAVLEDQQVRDETGNDVNVQITLPPPMQGAGSGVREVAEAGEPGAQWSLDPER